MRIAHRLDSIAFFILLATVFALPIVFVPTDLVVLQLTKLGVLTLGVMTSLTLWAVARLNEHRVTFPSTILLWSAIGLVGAHLIAALLSDAVIRSLIGFGFERDTTLALFVCVSALATVALVARTPLQVVRLQQTILGSFFLFGLFHVARILFGVDGVFGSIFSDTVTATLLGSWNDMAVFGGLAALLALSNLMLVGTTRLYRVFLYSVLVLALGALVFVNLAAAWGALLAFTLLLMVYAVVDASYSQESGVYAHTFPARRLLSGGIVALIAVLFLVAGTTLGERIIATFDIAYLDVRPSWQATIDVGNAVYQDNWIAGAGPNLFSRAWVIHKPLVVNETAFWNVDFGFGIGLIPTLFVTGGIIVGAALIVFFVAFLVLGFRILVHRPLQREHMLIAVSSYSAAAYLWVLAIFYVPQIVVLASAFILTGAAVGIAAASGVVRTRELTAHAGYAHGVALTFGVLIVGVLSVSAILIEAERVYANATLNRAVAIANTGDFARAVAVADRATLLGNGTRSEQLKANVGVARLSEILNRQDDDVAAQRQEFQTQLSATIRSAQAAANTESGNYNHWLLLADIYAQLVPLGVEGAYENAVTTYEEAQRRNPTTPVIPVSLARLALEQENLDLAREHIDRTLALKSNYTDAFFILSQIEIQAGNTTEAIRSTESAVLLRPDNAGLLFQLGLLYYSDGQYESAAQALEEAVRINEDYANALYFLGLSYDRLGNAAGAQAAFERVGALNPDNVEVQQIIEALRAGESAFSVFEEAEEAPIERDELPVSEES